MNRLHLEIIRQSTREPLVLDPRRMINAGYVGRDQATVRQHIEELQREGVAPPPSIPPHSALLVTRPESPEALESQPYSRPFVAVHS